MLTALFISFASSPVDAYTEGESGEVFICSGTTDSDLICLDSRFSDALTRTVFPFACFATDVTAQDHVVKLGDGDRLYNLTWDEIHVEDYTYSSFEASTTFDSEQEMFTDSDPLDDEQKVIVQKISGYFGTDTFAEGDTVVICGNLHYRYESSSSIRYAPYGEEEMYCTQQSQVDTVSVASEITFRYVSQDGSIDKTVGISFTYMLNTENLLTCELETSDNREEVSRLNESYITEYCESYLNMGGDRYTVNAYGRTYPPANTVEIGDNPSPIPSEFMDIEVLGYHSVPCFVIPSETYSGYENVVALMENRFDPDTGLDVDEKPGYAIPAAVLITLSVVALSAFLYLKRFTGHNEI